MIERTPAGNDWHRQGYKRRLLFSCSLRGLLEVEVEVEVEVEAGVEVEEEEAWGRWR